MNGGRDIRRQLRLDEFASTLGDAKGLPEKRLGGRSSQTDDHLGFERFDFGVQPWPAGGNLGGVGLFVNAKLASRLPVEMFYGVRDVNVGSINSGLSQRFIQQIPRRTPEWLSRLALLITRNFTHA